MIKYFLFKIFMIIYSLSKNINVQDLNHTNSEAQRVANLFLEEPGVQVSHYTRNQEYRLSLYKEPGVQISHYTRNLEYRIRLVIIQGTRSTG